MTIINQNLKSFFLDNDSIIEEFLNQNKEEQKEILNHVVPFKHYQKISFNWDNSDNVDSKDLIVYANEEPVLRDVPITKKSPYLFYIYLNYFSHNFVFHAFVS